MKVAKLPDGSPEVFYTIQGEGLNVGRPSTFLRLSLCNLHCYWCDTPYTWNWEKTPWETAKGEKFSKKDFILELSNAEIIDELTRHPCKNLVISGGEPLLQQKEILSLIDKLGEDWSVEVETNGTILPSSLTCRPDIQFNVSPKLSKSGNPKELAQNEKALKWFSTYPKASFKFVITSLEELEEVIDLQRKYCIEAQRIILMPEGTSSEKLRAASSQIIDLCLEHGFRFSDRLHVHIWGDTRAK